MNHNRFELSRQGFQHWVVWDHAFKRAETHFMGPGSKQIACAKTDFLNNQDKAWRRGTDHSVPKGALMSDTWFGLTPPADVEAAWGARGITEVVWHDNSASYQLFIPPDRQQMFGEVGELAVWIDKVALPKLKRELATSGTNLSVALRSEAGFTYFLRSEDKTFSLMARGKATNEYLYLVAWCGGQNLSINQIVVPTHPHTFHDTCKIGRTQLAGT